MNKTKLLVLCCLLAAAGAAADLFLVAAQHLEGAAAHGADAQKAHLNRFHVVAH